MAAEHHLQELNINNHPVDLCFSGVKGCFHYNVNLGSMHKLN